MRTNLKQVQWLVFFLSVCMALTTMWAGALAASTPAAGMSASSPPSLVQNFPSTEPEFETLRDAESIDNQTITALVQDPRGLIWIGTQKGLVRYDGYRFRKFAHKAGDPFSLAGDYIFSLAVAKDGRIWVGTYSDGISVFDPASERFEHFRHDEKVKDSLSGGTIWALASDAQGGIWIATGQGLDHFVKGSVRNGERSSVRFDHFKHSLDPHSLLDDQVRSLLLDKAGRLWVGSRSGLQRLSRDGKRFETVVAGKEVRTLFQAQDGKLWLGTREHGAGWLGGTPLDAPPPGDASPGGALPGGAPPLQVHWLPLAQLSHPWIAGIAQVQPDQIWLASSGGGIIVVAANDGQVLQTLRHDPALVGSLAFDTLKPLLLDRAGWLWVGTWGASLQRTNANNTMLRVLRHSPNRPNGLSHPDVRSILELFDGRLFIGSDGNGIDIFSRQQGLIGAWRVGQGQSQTGALPDAAIHSLAQTGDGSVWAGTLLAGVVRQRPGSSTWEAVPGLPGKYVPKLLAGRDGSVWAGTASGVARWQPRAQPPHPGSQTAPSPRFEVLMDEDGKTMQASVSTLAEDAQGRIWIGANNGLWLHDPGHKGLIHIPAESTRPDGLVSANILGLLVDSRGSLWVSTAKGLLRLKSREGKLARFEHVSALLGQPGKPLGENLLEDRQGRIWTEEGIIDGAAIRRATNGGAAMRMSHLTAVDSMNVGGTWQGSYAKTRDGLLFFGGTKGVVLIDPARFKAYDYAPPLVVTELKINGETVAPQSLINSQANPSSQANSGHSASLTLEPEQHNFAIEFAALDYSEPKKNRYQYRLQGYEKDWINTDSDHRIAAYGNLWPGLYTLQVRGSNRQGDWSVHELSIPIRVLPAWWQTWWFALVLLLSLGSLLTAVVQVRTRYLRQRQRELEHLVDERTSQLRQKQEDLIDANHELNKSHTELTAAHSQLQETQQQLMLQEKMAGLGTLTAGIAHEINNPTNFIHVSAQIQQAEIAEFEQFVAGLIEGDDGQKVLQAFKQRFARLSANVGTMLDGTERIIAIVRDLRSFSRLDESARKTVHLSECLHATVNLVRTGWLEKVDFITEFTDDPELECWPALLNQVFINLLLNGCQAIEDKQARADWSANEQGQQRGKVWLRMHLNPDKDALQIEFEDNGAGIVYAIQSRIMEPFFTTKAVGSGTGTGLSTAFGIVQKHGGSLEFTSNPGAGSCFTVTLPLAGA